MIPPQAAILPHGKPLFKAKYAHRNPEAVKSPTEVEEHLLTFYAFPQEMHRHIQTTNAIESFFSNVRQRTDKLVWLRQNQLREHRVGSDAGYSAPSGHGLVSRDHAREQEEAVGRFNQPTFCVHLIPLPNIASSL